MSNKTPNFNFVEPQVGDMVQQTISDLAANFQAIDTQIQNNANQIGNLSVLIPSPTSAQSSNAYATYKAWLDDQEIRNWEYGISVKGKKFGAKGDGTTDDTTALNNAFALGGTILIPPGTYLVTGMLSIPANTSVKGYPYLSKITVQSASNLTTLFNIQGSNCSIDGVWFENNNTTGCIDTNIAQNVSNVSFHRCKFTGQYAQGININSSGVYGVTVQSCTFDGVTYGVLLNMSYSGSTPQGAYDFKDLRIIGNRFTNIYGDAIELNNLIGTTGTTYTAMRDIAIEGNYIDAVNGTSSGSGFGIGVAGATNVTITGNVVKNCRWQGIHLEDHCRNVVVSANIVDGTGNVPAGSNNSGIYIIDGSYITIIGNSVYNCAYAGIHCEYDTTHQTTNTIIKGNTVNNCGNSGIIFNGNGSQNSIIEGNSLTGNSGDGIYLNGSGTNIKVINNISTGNTGYGLNFYNSKRGLSIHGNSLYGNTAGDINNANLSYPIVIKSNSNVWDAVVSSNYTPWTNCFSLGVGASGTIIITAVDDSGNRSTCLYTLSWNGTTLTTTLVNKSNNGNIDFTGGLQMSGNILQARTYDAGSASTNVHHEVQFEGMIMLK